MNANETREAMVGAYLLPTIGLNPFVICLLAWLRYALDVVEIFSKSGIRDFWNFMGKSENSDTKSVSSSRSTQLEASDFMGFFSADFWAFKFWVFLVVVVVVFLGEMGSKIFLVESFVEFKVFDDNVEFSFLILEVELSFFSSILVLLAFDDNKVVVLVELVFLVLLNLVWFLEEIMVLMGLVWFLEERVLEIFFLGLTIGSSSSFSSTPNIFLLPTNLEFSEQAQRRTEAKTNRTK